MSIYLKWYLWYTSDSHLNHQKGHISKIEDSKDASISLGNRQLKQILLLKNMFFNIHVCLPDGITWYIIETKIGSSPSHYDTIEGCMTAFQESEARLAPEVEELDAQWLELRLLIFSLFVHVLYVRPNLCVNGFFLWSSHSVFPLVGLFVFFFRSHEPTMMVVQSPFHFFCFLVRAYHFKSISWGSNLRPKRCGRALPRKWRSCRRRSSCNAMLSSRTSRPCRAVAGRLACLNGSFILAILDIFIVTFLITKRIHSAGSFCAFILCTPTKITYNCNILQYRCNMM